MTTDLKRTHSLNEQGYSRAAVSTCVYIFEGIFQTVVLPAKVRRSLKAPHPSYIGNTPRWWESYALL